MSGRIVVESRLGKGSTFTVHLPLPKVSGHEATLRHAPALDPDKVDKEVAELRALAAEDNQINQLVLSTFLQQIGVTPTTVEDGVLAVEAWRAGAFDMILMDSRCR